MKTVEDIAPLWRLAFRAGFLAAASFGVLAMVRWLLWLSWPQAWPTDTSPTWWHAHEMIFGFALPVVAGFLLTAVATWTGLPGTCGRPLQVLFGLWLTARAVLWLAPQWLALAWLAETLFLLLLGFELGRRVWARRQWRNILFLPLLLVLLVLCSASYLSVDEPTAATRLHYGAVWMISVFVVIIGGRVIPLFTSNRLGLKLAPSPPWLEYLAIGSVALVGLASSVGAGSRSAPWLATLCLATSALHFYRLVRWQGWKALRVPLLWSMHLSYLCIPLALLGLALVRGDPVAEKNIIHLLAIGAIGGMILTMMSRVSLGHTGRPLEVPYYLSLAFAFILLAAVIRSVLPLADTALSLLSWRVSAVLWIMVFCIFLYRYVPVLTRPRADGRPG
jgi:uncharacterized protein involved in response to NO